MENYLIEATENNDKLEFLNQMLCRIFNPTKELIKLLEDSYELILESNNFNDETFLQTCLRMAELGANTNQLRNKINDYIVNIFDDYNDVVADHLNLLDLSLSDVAINFNKLLILFAKKLSFSVKVKESLDTSYVYHQQFNFGKVVDIIDQKQLKVTFISGEKILGLQFIMKQCICFRNDSFINQFLQGKKVNVNDFFQKDICEKTYGDVVPITELKKTIIIHIMMPKYFKKAALFDQWYARKKTNIEENTKRLWLDSRSLAELLQTIKLKEKLQWNDEAEKKLLLLFHKEGEKNNQALIFAHCLILLWEKMEDKKMIVNLSRKIGKKSIIWQERDLFEEVCDKLNISQLNCFMKITSYARNQWLKQVVFSLPLRVYDSVYKALLDVNQQDDLLLEGKKLIKDKKLSCDAILFFWKYYSKEKLKIKNFIDSPELIFRALNEKGLSAHFAKSKKILKEMFLNDKGQDFLRFILGDGQKNKIKILVDSTQSTTCFDDSEKQSLLIRIVRLYDYSKNIIEGSITSKVSQAKIPRITALVNYHTKQDELTQIIKEIPKNTKAISIAREHGDLRENAEYQAAKERQKYLLSRRSELDNLLQEIQPTNFADIKVKDRVIPGSRVHLAIGKDNVVYTILGVLDSNPSKSYLSFETPLGKLLVGKSINDEIILPNSNKVASIKSIQPLTKEILQWINSDA